MSPVAGSPVLADDLLGGLPSAEAIPQKIADLDEVRNYIDAIDFNMLKEKTVSDGEAGLGWTMAHLDFVERQYKRWLYLRRTYSGEVLPPGDEIDEFWHLHILDTRAYIRDTAAIFGHYLHHYPYFGLRGADDEQRLLQAYENTRRRYREEYHDEIWVYDEDQPAT